MPPETGQVAADRKGIPFPTATHQVSPVLRYLVMSLGVIAAGILLLYLWHGEELLTGAVVSLPPAKPPAAAPASPPASTTTMNLNPTVIDNPPAAAPASANPAPPPAPARVEVAAQPAPPLERAADTGRTEKTDKTADKAVDRQSPKPVPPAVTGSATGGPRRILLAFDRDSWVEVKDGNGRILFSQLNIAGSQQVIEGRAPFELVIGNAAHVKLHYRDEPVDLKLYTKAEVARLSLN
jgi:cytoskeleton protein RodZ